MLTLQGQGTFPFRSTRSDLNIPGTALLFTFIKASALLILFSGLISDCFGFTLISTEQDLNRIAKLLTQVFRATIPRQSFITGIRSKTDRNPEEIATDTLEAEDIICSLFRIKGGCATRHEHAFLQFERDAKRNLFGYTTIGGYTGNVYLIVETGDDLHWLSIESRNKQRILRAEDKSACKHWLKTYVQDLSTCILFSGKKGYNQLPTRETLKPLQYQDILNQGQGALMASTSSMKKELEKIARKEEAERNRLKAKQQDTPYYQFASFPPQK